MEVERMDILLPAFLPGDFRPKNCPFDPLPIPQATGKTMKSRRAREMAANIAPADMGHMKVCSDVPTHRNFQAPVGGRGGEGGILLPGHIRTSQSPFCPRACC